MDYFDLADPHDGRLAGAFADSKDVRFTLVSFDTDWLYPTSESRRVVQALQSVGAAASFVELSAPFGHDSFLLDVRSEEHTSELQSLMRISYAVFCLKKKKHNITKKTNSYDNKIHITMRSKI